MKRVLIAIDRELRKASIGSPPASPRSPSSQLGCRDWRQAEPRPPSAAVVALAGLVALASCGPPRPSNRGGPVVLITLEALRADMVSGLGGEPGLTPNLAG